ncbi:MAG: FtsX-like permease family protein [Vicinamibacterales bacterium]|jgi:ABC-type antimicrobial peptide transport system permease subunit
MLTRASLRFYAATHAMVVLGVAVAVAVLAGALLVGSSVRDSLAQIALGRLGATDVIVTSPTFFRTALADNLLTRSTQPQQSPMGARLDPYRVLRSAAPLVVFGGAVVHDESKRTAGRVMVYGIDERFGRFHGVNGFEVSGREALISAALAQEVGAKAGDTLTMRVAKPSDIPLSSLQGRRETTGERIRVTVARVLDESSLGEFSLAPAQGPVFAIYVPMGRLQRDLGLGDRANTILLALNGPADVEPAELVRDLIMPAAALDDLGLRVRATAAATTLVETRAGLLTDDLVTSIEDLAARDHRTIVPALTYVVNSIRIGDREIPYSTVSAIDLDSYNRQSGAVGPEKGAGDLLEKDPRPLFPGHPPVWLNEWAANDLKARLGDEVTLEYFLWSDADGLSSASASFTLVGITPMTGIGGDPTLTPDYPGISDAADMTSWDPPFPVDLKRVRKQDEDYWDRWRAAPKAIIPLAEGQRLWGSRYGRVSSMRLSGRAAIAAQGIPSAASGFTARAVRGEATAAAQGTTDFGEYFLYFSFFLVVSALLLAYLFFAVGLEQRTREIGLLAAVGFAPSAIRRAFVREGAVLAGLGTIIGIAAAIGYAALIMYGLRTWWVGAVGTTRLTLHVAPEWLAAGAAGALAAGVLAIWMGVRKLSHRSARSLLKGEADVTAAGSATRARVLAIGLGILGVILITAAATGWLNPTAGFFGAGGAWLVAGLCGASAWLRRPRRSRPLTRGLTGMSQLGFRHATVHPNRSVLSLALIAFACFVLVSVGAFRKDPASGAGDKTSGTGGFALMAESVAPLMHDPNTPDGRDGLGLNTGDPFVAGARITRFRLRPGDETSCLTLYRPTNPRIIAPEPRFIAESRFTFAASMASTPEEHANPWTLLNRTFDDGAVAAVADQTTLMYVLHLGIGDDFAFTPEGQPPVRLRIVGALADSVLQSEIMIGEPAFVRLFPRQEGYRLWMIETADGAAVTSHLEDRLSDYGMDISDTLGRWSSYHQVENTYLATFQALGSLGLLLGTVGLGAVLARNVLERRREIGLLNAVGFTPGNIRGMVLSEGLALVLGGVLLGAACAMVAVWPAVSERAQAVPAGSLLGLMLAVVATGIASSLFAVRLASAMPVVQAIKSE